MLRHHELHTPAGIIRYSTPEEVRDFLIDAVQPHALRFDINPYSYSAGHAIGLELVARDLGAAKCLIRVYFERVTQTELHTLDSDEKKSARLSRYAATVMLAWDEAEERPLADAQARLVHYRNVADVAISIQGFISTLDYDIASVEETVSQK